PAVAPAGLATEAAPEADGVTVAPPPTERRGYTGETVVVATPELDPTRIAGSAFAVNEEELSRFEYVDIHRVLEKVPGVYMRGEDGFGLRPNIGLRGASSERSSKVALMEDGILFAPAPYSAPAAYYFPSVNRLSGVEVYKGPAAIRFGPNTVGGAVNLITRPIPEQGMAGELDASAGLNRTGRLHGAWGYGSDRFGILLEGVHGQSAGFKVLDNGGDTGFDKNELMLKARIGTDPAASVAHRLELKLGYADEVSDESYLGLTDEDYAATPYRRYAASALDRMDWTRTLAQLTYSLRVGQPFELKVTAYRNDFTRAWTKLDHLQHGTRRIALDRLLHAPGGTNAVYLAMLRGEQDSEDAELILGTNDRTFVSQGIQADGAWSLQHGSFSQLIRFGARLHNDRADRRVLDHPYAMRGGTLVSIGEQTEASRTVGETLAGSLYAVDEITISKLLLTPGARVELIQNWLDPADRQFRAVVLPGVGALYSLTKHLNVLAGVYRGFSPVSPGQASGVSPELSTNYEAGARFERRATKAELVGFFNDYSNLTGECTISSCGDIDLLNRQFNGGRVHVYGLEAALSHGMPGPWQSIVELKAAYTLTRSRFLTSFESESPQFGNVLEGDELPYVPTHQASLGAVLIGEKWSVGATATYAGAMREVAGQGEISEAELVPHHVVIDLAASYRPAAPSEIYVTVENLLNTPYLAARRPFGARPGRPLFVQAGYKHHF
ncbi:MAG: TonB-dependent receptor, partial [Myxococcaceae bacterium]